MSIHVGTYLITRKMRGCRFFPRLLSSYVCINTQKHGPLEEREDDRYFALCCTSAMLKFSRRSADTLNRRQGSNNYQAATAVSVTRHENAVADSC